MGPDPMGCMMRPSRFNVVFRVDDRTTLVYNTLSNALAELTDEEGHHLEHWLQCPTDDYFELRSLTELQKKFSELGVIVADDDDELARLRSLSVGLKQQDRRFGKPAFEPEDRDFLLGGRGGRGLHLVSDVGLWRIGSR